MKIGVKLMNASIRKQLGFTLAEMAIVVLLIGVMLTTSLSMLNVQIDQSALSQTKIKQETIRQALIHYLRVNGVLPCPDSKTIAPPINGQAVSPCTAGNSGRGVVPWQTLGLPRDTAIDGWGNFMTYRVGNNNPNPRKNWTDKVASTPFSIAEYTNPITGFAIQERNPLNVLTNINTQSVAVVVSHGKNGSGARRKDGTQEPLPALPLYVDERINATANTTNFVMRPWSETATQVQGGPFDDVVMYLIPTDLIKPLIDDKTLIGGCTAYCSPSGPGCSFSGSPIGLSSGTCP